MQRVSSLSPSGGKHFIFLSILYLIFSYIFSDVSCVGVDDSNTDDTYVCNRYALQMPFQQSREIPAGRVKGNLLEVSDRIKGDLPAVYSGAQTVSSEQVIELNNAAPVELEDETTFCFGIQDQLTESYYLINYTVLDVNCESFNFVPFEASDDQPVGNLEVDYKVTGEYTPADREEDIELREQFGGLVEVSFCAYLN